jgi:ketosteroid isomerase-like protein
LLIHLEDRAAIGDLVRAYASSLDRLDEEWFATLWTDDAVATVYRPEPGAERVPLSGADLMAIPRRLAELWERTFHVVTNHTVRVDGDTASGEVYCIAHHARAAGRVHVNHTMTIRYDDEYRRVMDEWRFARREIYILWTRDETITGPIARRGETAD